MGRTITRQGWWDELSRRGKALGHYYPCPDARVEPGRWVRSILQGFIDPRLHSDPAHGADPTRGAEWMSSSMKFCVLHSGKVAYIAGADPAFCLHTQKCGVRPRMRGRTLQIWRSTKGGSDPAIRAGDLCLHWGEKGGSDPAIGALCKRSISCRAAQWVVVILPQLNSKE